MRGPHAQAHVRELPPSKVFVITRLAVAACSTRIWMARNREQLVRSISSDFTPISGAHSLSGLNLGIH